MTAKEKTGNVKCKKIPVFSTNVSVCVSDSTQLIFSFFRLVDDKLKLPTIKNDWKETVSMPVLFAVVVIIIVVVVTCHTAINPELKSNRIIWNIA